MTTHQINVFISVFEMRSITAAAETLYISQPGVSSIIKSIEQELGVKLFERQGKNVKPTDACITVYSSVKKIQQIDQNLRYSISEHKYQSFLRLGTGIAFGENFLPDILPRFQKQYPNCNVYCIVDSMSTIEPMLLKSELDICIGESSIYHHSGLSYQELYHSPLVAICNSSHPLAKYQEVNADQLASYNLLFRNKGSQTRMATDVYFSGHNRPVQPILESDSSTALIRAAKENLGVAIITLDHYAVSSFDNILALKINNLNFVRYMDIVYNKNLILSPIDKAFIAFTKNYIQSLNLDTVVSCEP